MAITRIDDSPARAANAEFHALIDALSPNAIKVALPLIERAGEHPENLFVIKLPFTSAVAGTSDGRALLEPSASFKELIIAIRAIKADQAMLGIPERAP